MTKLQYLKKVLDYRRVIPHYPTMQPMFSIPPRLYRRVTARLGPPAPPLHCPPHTTNRNKPTKFRVYYK